MGKAILRIIFGIVTVVLLLVGVALALNWTLNQPPVRMEELKAIKPGTTREEVQGALGKPTSI